MSQTENERLEELAYNQYLHFYSHPNDSIHYAEINQMLAEKGLETGLPLCDFIADCIDLGVSHGNSDGEPLDKQEMIDRILNYLN